MCCDAGIADVRRGVISIGIAVLLSAFLFSACQSVNTNGHPTVPGSEAPKTSILNSPTPDDTGVKPSIAVEESSSPTPHPADIILLPAQKDTPIQAKVGDVIAVRPPLPQLEWQVSYTADLIMPLTPPDGMRNPSAEGWLFQPIALGVSNITLTSISKPCPTQTPCSPNVARFVYIIDVRK